jgi:hypothetical protein
MEQLSTKQINCFIQDGFIKIENAFSTELAAECRAILWKETKCDPDNPLSWTQPVIRIGELGFDPFKKAANTNVLLNAYDQLAGIDNWHPKETLGSFPIRFPCKETASDTGWHVDASFPGDDLANYFDWRININSKGRALLMLFLFSDISEIDGPTIIKVGSHFDVAKILEKEGEKGLSFIELANKLDSLPKRKVAIATGKAGTVYLCHPFVVHAGQDVKGTKPKFMAQPALLTKKDFNIKSKIEKLCPVEIAIIKGLNSNIVDDKINHS